MINTLKFYIESINYFNLLNNYGTFLNIKKNH